MPVLAYHLPAIWCKLEPFAEHCKATQRIMSLRPRLTYLRAGDFHFWDAPDDITGASMDLVFERDRLYLHQAKGYFGAVPLNVSGDMDLNPQSGTYRLQVGSGRVGKGQ